MKYTTKSLFLVYYIDDNGDIYNPTDPMTFEQIAKAFGLEWSDGMGLEKIGNVEPFNNVTALYESIIKKDKLFYVEKDYDVYPRPEPKEVYDSKQQKNIVIYTQDPNVHHIKKGRYAVIYKEELPGDAGYILNDKLPSLKYHVYSLFETNEEKELEKAKENSKKIAPIAQRFINKVSERKKHED